MELNFICPHHEHRILRDGVCAAELWHGLSTQGKGEAQMSHWAKAASYFGSATEVAIIRASVEQNQTQLDYLNMAMYTGRWLIEAFCQLGDSHSAKRYLNLTEHNISHLIEREPCIKNSLLSDEKLKASIFNFLQACHANIKHHELSAPYSSETSSKTPNGSKKNSHLTLVFSKTSAQASALH